MPPLSNDQIEDILAGRAEEPDDLDVASSQRLADQRALRERLQQALDSVVPPQGMHDRLRSAIHQETSALSRDVTTESASTKRIRLVRWGLGLATAAMLAIAISILIQSTPTAYAHDAMVRIHNSNVPDRDDFEPCGNGVSIARRIEKVCGETVHIPEQFPALGEDCGFVGSTLATFDEQPIVAAMVRMDSHKVTVFRIHRKIATLGFGHPFRRMNLNWAHCGHRNCTLVAVEVDEHTFIAVGEVPHETLIELLVPFAKANLPADEIMTP